MVLVFRAQTCYIQMVKIKKPNPTKHKTPTKQSMPPFPPIKSLQGYVLLWKYKLAFNLEHWTCHLVKTELPSKVPQSVNPRIPKPVLLYYLIHLIPSVTEVCGTGHARRSLTVRIDLSYLEKGWKDFIEILLWRPEVCRSQRHDDFRIWGVYFCHLKCCVSLSRGNITLGFKPEKVIGYVFSVSCNWWSDLLRGRINLPLSQKGLAENCSFGFLILFYPKCHVALWVAGEIFVVVESVKSW